MAVVNRGESSIATLSGTALHTKAHEDKDNDETQDEWYGMEEKKEKDKAAQAGVRQSGEQYQRA